MKSILASALLILLSIVSAPAAPSEPEKLIGAFENVLGNPKCEPLGGVPLRFVEHFWSGNTPNHYFIHVRPNERILTSKVNDSEATKLTLDFGTGAIGHAPSGLGEVTDCTLEENHALCTGVLERYLDVTQDLIEKEGWLQTTEEHAQDERMGHRFRKFESESHGKIADLLGCVNWLTQEFLKFLKQP